LERSGATVWITFLSSACSNLRQILTSYSSYYNKTRTHLSLDKDAPLRRAVQRCGTIVATPILSGLHHQYTRI
jgi:hypothetical protein